MEPVLPRKKIHLLNCLALAGLFASTAAPPAQSQPIKFVLPADDGYGVEDCLINRNECGQTVADAWCEAHGQGNAIDFGVQEASVAKNGSLNSSLAGVEITCGN